MWRRELIAVVAAIASVGCVGATPVHADVVIGATLSNPPFGAQACQGTACTLTQQSDPDAGFVLTVPTDGVITSWRAVGDGPVRLRVLREVGAGRFSGVATSAPAELDASGPVNRVNMPVRSGDRIGVDLDAGTPSPTLQAPRIAYADVNGASYAFFEPPLPDGATASPFGSVSGAELLVQATVSAPRPGGGPGPVGGPDDGTSGQPACVVPNLRGKTPRRARRALVAAGCSLGRVKRAKHRRHSRRRHVVSQSEPPGTRKPPAARVDVYVG
jgi:PASTA domain